MEIRWSEAGNLPVWLCNKLTVSNKRPSLCAESCKVIANMKHAGKTQVEIAQAVEFSQSPPR